MGYHRWKTQDHEFLERYIKAKQSIRDRKSKLMQFFIEGYISAEKVTELLNKLNEEEEFAEKVYILKDLKRKQLLDQRK